MMIRTQVQLTTTQARRLKRLAQREGVSVAEVVRRCIDRTLKDPGTERSALYAQAGALVGAFADEARVKDLSRRHDAYLEDAFR